MWACAIINSVPPSLQGEKLARVLASISQRFLLEREIHRSLSLSLPLSCVPVLFPAYAWPD